MPYTVYSKAFAKKGCDINKNDFGSPKFKVEAKAKSASGVGFKFEGSDNAKEGKYEDGKVEITVPVDDKFKVTLETTAAAATTVSAEMKVTKDATLKLVAANPDIGNPSAMGVSGELNFLDPKFAVEGKFCLWDGPSVAKIPEVEDEKTKKKSKAPFYATGTHGIQAGFTFDAPGIDGVTVGLCPGIGIGTKGNIGFQLPMSVGYSAKDMSLAFVTGMAMCPKSVADPKDAKKKIETKGFEIACAGLKGHFKIQDDLLFGFEADQVFYKLDAKKLWAAKGVAKKAESQVFKAGLQYTPSKDTTYKLKGTFTKGAGLDIDMSVKTALAGSNSVLATCTVPYGKDTAPKVGLTYNLEA